MTIPNLLSLVRILIIPFFVQLFLHAQTFEQRLAAVLILLLSGLTDALDGWIARRFHMCSDLGKVLDPAADKLTLLAVIVCLWIRVPELWPLYAIFIGKELLMVVGSLFVLRKNRDIKGAKWFGKLFTILFYTVVPLVILSPGDGLAFQAAALALLALVTIFSLGMYIPVFLAQLKEQK